MPISARPALSSRPWLAAVLAVALMLSLAAIMAPAVATETQPDGSVEFVDPPAYLVADEATFEITVTGDFAIDAAVLAGGVTRIVVTVDLMSGDGTVVASGENATELVAGDPTATVTLDLKAVETGEYTVQATATTYPAPGVELGTATLGPLSYFSNATECESDCTVEESNGGFTATVELLGGGLVSLELPDTSPYILDADACPGDHTRLPETVLFDIIVPDDGADTATITVDLTRRARQQETNNGISQYQFCYIGGAPFTDRDGHPAVHFSAEGFPKLTHGPALLPDCSANGSEAPCVVDRTSTRGGGAQFTFLVPTGDPMFR